MRNIVGLLIMGLAATVAFASFGPESAPSVHKGTPRLSEFLPDPESVGGNQCIAEAAAYSAALADLHAAEQVANTTYQAWYDCMMGTGSACEDCAAAQPIPGPERSVLVQN